MSKRTYPICHPCIEFAEWIMDFLLLFFTTVTYVLRGIFQNTAFLNHNYWNWLKNYPIIKNITPLSALGYGFHRSINGDDKTQLTCTFFYAYIHSVFDDRATSYLICSIPCRPVDKKVLERTALEHLREGCTLGEGLSWPDHHRWKLEHLKTIRKKYHK